MAGHTVDWMAVVDRLLAGDRRAFLELNRLVTGFLVQLRAYDFRDEWDDLRQEVIIGVVANARAGRLRDPCAFLGYVRILTRNKFVDRLKTRLRRHEGHKAPNRLAGRQAALSQGTKADRVATRRQRLERFVPRQKIPRRVRLKNVRRSPAGIQLHIDPPRQVPRIRRDALAAHPAIREDLPRAPPVGDG